MANSSTDYLITLDPLPYQIIELFYFLLLALPLSFDFDTNFLLL